MLKASNIIKNYGTISVLKGIDIQVEKGEFISIVGASGAGKSTLLQILGTLDNADNGDIIFDNESITKLKGKALSKLRNEKIGFIFQFHHLLPEFSALENVCIPAWIKGENKAKAEEDAMVLLEKMGLKERAHHKPNQLSGGEQQRVAIARALINNPKIIFADEPTGNLDSKNSFEIFDILQSLAKQGQTIIMVTHNDTLAQKCDRIIELKDGKVFSDQSRLVAKEI
jgi:lipoprotein-releasing system ATP-binding protein